MFSDLEPRVALLSLFFNELRGLTEINALSLQILSRGSAKPDDATYFRPSCHTLQSCGCWVGLCQRSDWETVGRLAITIILSAAYESYSDKFFKTVRVTAA